MSERSATVLPAGWGPNGPTPGRGHRVERRPETARGAIAHMMRKTIHARSGTSPEAVEAAVRKARTEAGVELILVVYEGRTAHLYVEKERHGRKRAVPKSDGVA